MSLRRVGSRTKNIWTGANRLLRVTVVLAAVAAYIWVLPSAFGGGSSSSSSYSYGYGYGYGQDRVTICHKGKTNVVAVPALAAHLAHGDTVGPCP
jgi:hypothetical protein